LVTICEENTLNHGYQTALFVGIFMFISLKVKDLYLPFFWDELGVYAPAAQYLYEHGISMQPKHLPSELSRGHPMLYVCLSAIWMKIAGTTVFARHLLPLATAVGVLISVFVIGKKHFGEKVGLAAALLLAAQPLFVAQSVLILPEMMLALMVLWAIHCFVVRNYVLYTLFAACAFLTKEPGILLAGAMATGAGIEWLRDIRLNIRGQLPTKPSFLPIIIAIAPVLVMIGFFCLQKIQHGWYLFPVHEDMINFGQFSQAATDFAKFIFLQQGRMCMTMLLLLSIGIRLVRRQDMTRIEGFFLLMALFMYLFSSVNAYMNRYMLMLLPLLALSSAYGLYRILPHKTAWLAGYALTIGLLIGLGYNALSDNTFRYDEDMGYVQQVHVQHQLIHHIETLAPDTAHISAVFPVIYGLLDPYSGYLSGNKTFSHISLNFKPQTMYLCITEPGGVHALPDSVRQHMHLIQSFDDGYAHAYLYKVQ
jgi:4-amino-4-deoxy-L-arabinose transferase-like glycosyltransferase